MRVIDLILQKMLFTSKSIKHKVHHSLCEGSEEVINILSRSSFIQEELFNNGDALLECEDVLSISITAQHIDSDTGIVYIATLAYMDNTSVCGAYGRLPDEAYVLLIQNILRSNGYNILAEQLCYDESYLNT